MFEVWKLKRKRLKVQKRVSREIREASRDGNPPFLDEFVAERIQQLRAVNAEIRECHTRVLVRDAERLDIELPEDEMEWERDNNGVRQALTTAGRATLRRQIAEESTRRREVNAWCWKNVVVPAITALTGLAGVITGMIAVIHAKK